MKTRIGFVSNSSSSSFIVIANVKGSYFPPSLPANFTLGEYGEKEFGWQQERYSDFYSKINFAYIQARAAQDAGNNDWMTMISTVLQACGVVNLLVSIVTSYDYDGPDWAYIDHASAYCKDQAQNCEMFDSEEELRNFLFNSESYIENDNDNH